MPNQHVVPRGTKWAVKGEGNSRATILTNTNKKPLIKPVKFPKIKERNWSFTIEMAKSAKKIPMATTHVHQKVRNIDFFLLKDCAVRCAVFFAIIIPRLQLYTNRQ